MQTTTRTRDLVADNTAHSRDNRTSDVSFPCRDGNILTTGHRRTGRCGNSFPQWPRIGNLSRTPMGFRAPCFKQNGAVVHCVVVKVSWTPGRYPTLPSGVPALQVALAGCNLGYCTLFRFSISYQLIWKPLTLQRSDVICLRFCGTLVISNS